MGEAPRAGAVRVWRAPTTTSNPSSGSQRRDGEMPSLHVVKELLEAHGIEPRPVSGEYGWSSCAAHWVPLEGCNQRRFPRIFPVFEQITASFGLLANVCGSRPES